jgi:hypothetical protein
MGTFLTIRRWSLKAGADEASVIELIQGAILPAYRAWPDCEKLELRRVAGSNSYITTTHWVTRAAHQEFEGDAGAAWREGYRATLERWDQLMEFEEEWFGEVILNNANT